MKHIKMIIPALVALGFALAAGGCTVHGTTRVHGQAHVETPQLVSVSPGVQVVYDHHEPVFYSEGYYWRYNSGVWYRSSYHSRGWVRYRRVPRAVVRIDRPQAYVRYRGNVRARGRVHSRPARSHSPARPVVRDHRRPAPVKARPVRGPSVRGSATIRSNRRGTSKPVKSRAHDRRDKNKSKSKSKSKVRTRDHRR